MSQPQCWELAISYDPLCGFIRDANSFTPAKIQESGVVLYFPCWY